MIDEEYVLSTLLILPLVSKSYILKIDHNLKKIHFNILNLLNFEQDRSMTSGRTECLVGIKHHASYFPYVVALDT